MRDDCFAFLAIRSFNKYMALRRLAPAARGAAVGAILPQGLLQRQTTILSIRKISLIPWRKSNAPALPTPPVYFAMPKPVQRSRPIRRYFVRFLLLSAAILLCHHLHLMAVEIITEEIENGEMEEGETLTLFLPTPFSVIRVDQPPYRNNDPEWRELRAFALNQSLTTETKEKLLKALATILADRYARAIGGKQIHGCKAWLEVTYPDQPPPKHYVAGIFFSDEEGISWRHKPVNQDVANRYTYAAYPTVVAKSAWVFVTVLIRVAAEDAAIYLGLWKPPPNEVRVVRYFPSRPGNDVYTHWPYPRVIRDIVLPPFMREAPTPYSFKRATMNALSYLYHNWKPLAIDPGPNCVTVEGLVHALGPKAGLTVFVRAYYDVRRKEFMYLYYDKVNVMPYSKYPNSRN